jgi:hypothetical protein
MSERLTVSREAPHGSGVASISRRLSHHDGLTRVLVALRLRHDVPDAPADAKGSRE